MTRIVSFPRAAFAPIALLGMVAGISLNAGPANAVVYCKYIGVPKGCVARPGEVTSAIFDRHQTMHPERYEILAGKALDGARGRCRAGAD
jgi:hypothetical protein